MDSNADPSSGPVSPRTLPWMAAAAVALWVPLAILHPVATDMLAGATGIWLVVHWAQLLLAPALALILLAVLRGVPGPSAVVARIAVVVWVGLFSATDAVAGIATGLLIEGGFSVAARFIWDHVLVSGGAGVLPVIAHWAAWPTAVVAGGLALARDGAPRRVTGPMFVAVLFMFPGHGNELSAIGAIALAVAVFGAMTAPRERAAAASR